MSTTVTYKGQTLTTVENQTKTLNTAGTWVEGDFTLTDVTASGGGDELYNLINGTITDAEIDWSKITNPKEAAFRDCKNLTSVDNPTFTNGFLSDLFRGCSNLTHLEVSTTMLNPQYGNSTMRACPKVKEITLHFLHPNPANTGVFAGTYFFCDDTILETVILHVASNGGFRLSSSNLFYSTPALRNLVLKFDKGVVNYYSGGWGLGHWGGIYSNPTESTIYVPQALISDYQTATNWSNLYAAGVTFAPIEGSIYDD